MEYLDIYDENGNYLGEEERSIVHRDALWHKTIHCWLYDQEGNVYFQIRKDKGKLYTTASGHVQAKETLEEAFAREIEEEIGYKIDYKKAKKIEMVPFRMDREEKDGSVFKDRAFANVYGCIFEGSLNDFDFQESELLGIVKMNAKQALEIIKNEKGNLKAQKCYKENHILKIADITISFEDFLVNKGETALGKYGKVLEFIVSEISNF